VNSTINTGVAVVNTSNQSAVAVLRLLNSTGVPVAEQVISMAPGEHFARFIDQLFSGVPGIGNFEGVLTIRSSDPLATVAVRMQLQASLTISALPVSTFSEEGDERDLNLNPWLGTYRGTWTNPEAGTSGAARIDITANLAARTAVVTLNFDGNYLGLNDPPPQSLPGTIETGGVRVRGQSAVFGNADVFISPSGYIIGFVTQAAGGAIPRITYTGQLTPARLDAEYLVLLPNGQVVTSILHTERADW
jgi:hypothetical protein